MQGLSGAWPSARDAPVRTLSESDYLLGVSDETRLGALRLRRGNEFQAPMGSGVPALVDLGRLLQITERILRDEETDEDLTLIFAPGSSLGGARPRHRHHPSISMDISPSRSSQGNRRVQHRDWEEIALRLAERAGIAHNHTTSCQDRGVRPCCFSRRV